MGILKGFLVEAAGERAQHEHEQSWFGQQRLRLGMFSTIFS